MSYQLNDKLSALVPYQPISGDYKIRLDANESYLNFADGFAGRFASVVANLDFNRYPDPYAGKLCKTFADRYSLNADFITASNGSDEMIGVIIASFLKKGETMLTLTPDFSMYTFYAEMYECKVNSLDKGESLEINPETVLKALRDTGARLLIFSNPCNPTSLGLAREDVLKIVQGTDALVVIDEAYMDFWDQSILDVACDYDNVIVLKTCSKAVGAAAIRLGFAIANQALTNAMRAAKSPYNVSALTQAVGEVILSERNLLQRCVKEILNSKNDLQASLQTLAEEKSDITKVFESCTNFIFVKLANAKTVYEALLSKSIAVRHMGDYLRITAGSEDENKELLKELRQILQ
ncbi:histidinol-phosphate transaminase [Hydrogenoanaerobacterium sp.]|uniref:pyridoxal phosphate-dependent aminotransferase n=1 Tax=Hydrogenoanaerobacterium sp. TaxID=2953763 RepID=UPI0028A07A0F|nr:histidinol-phosphate transaminase [Hydrogenoanaerobacterium sp.]